MATRRILLIDDRRPTRERPDVDVARSVSEALTMVSSHAYDTVIVRDDRGTAAQIRREHPDLTILVAVELEELHHIEFEREQLRQSNARLQSELIERRRSEDRLRHNALHDSLTELPNRALLTERIERAIIRSKRDPGYKYAVLFIDLDAFKDVNDSLGHRAGDELLVEFALRLATCFRALDTAARPADDTTARLGGDEFVVLLDGLRSTADALHIAERIQDTLAAPFRVAGAEVAITASMGIATNDQSYEDSHEVLRDADAALYEAKASGRGCAVVFTPELQAQVMARAQLEHDLTFTIERRQLALAYQPIVSLETGRIDGFEALLRWHHPERGLVAPAVFIPAAERIGMIEAIGRWVIDEAGRQAALWSKSYPECEGAAISVNVSSHQMESEDFVGHVRDVVTRTGLEPSRLRLEITETLMMDPDGVTARKLDELRRIGVQIQLDDFGAGASSLSFLHGLPVDAVKVDRDFVHGMSLDGKHAATIQAVVVLARSRGFKVIAEGVETVEQLAQLQSLDVDHAQGFYFSKPIDADAAEALLRSGGTWRGFAA